MKIMNRVWRYLSHQAVGENLNAMGTAWERGGHGKSAESDKDR